MESAFFGTPAAALPVLRALAGASQLRQVWTRPPAKAGRGMARRPSPVQEAGEALGATVFAPASGAEAEALANKGALQGVELAVVFAYGLRLPPAVLQAPRLGCINLHPSLLPRWRGAAPVQAAILAGERASGWSWIRMTERMDAGPVLAAGETPIGREETAGRTGSTAHSGGSRRPARTSAGLGAGRGPRARPRGGACHERAQTFRRRAAAGLARARRRPCPPRARLRPAPRCLGRAAGQCARQGARPLRSRRSGRRGRSGSAKNTPPAGHARA